VKTKACGHCGATFQPTGSRSSYCSARCRLRAGAARNPLSGCLEWQGAIGSHGYGAMNLGGTAVLAHRLMYEIERGAVPAGNYVCHTCDNRKCIEPSHLFAGSPTDNVMDMVRKGRHWSKGRILPEEFRAKLRVPKRRLAKAMREG